MAIPTLRIAIPRTQPFFLSVSPCNRKPSDVNLTSKKNYRPLCCASAELDPVRSHVTFCVGTHVIPHPNKAERGGEDAFFVSSYRGGVLAVADGVSGWAEQNVDPSLFSRQLIANASCLVENEEVNYNPQFLIRRAHADVTTAGSATIIVAMLEENGTLKIANVGDCGLKLIRGNRIIFSTSPQEHYFDCPYQLSSEPVGQTYIDAVVSTVQVMEGDRMVMASDGLFDNVFDHEIVSTIMKHGDVEEAAKALAILANNHSTDTQFESPYSVEARSKGYDVPLWRKIFGMKLTGGKLDDITVIVGKVVSSSSIANI